MDEPALRDVERWKDRIEVRLDNRQVFFLFFGSAMVACMLFVLGVIVGKRLESRGRALAPVVEDPLAALDRFGADRGGIGPAPSALTFPRALLGGGTAAAVMTKGERAERAVSKPTLANVVTLAPAAPSMASPASAHMASPASAHEVPSAKVAMRLRHPGGQATDAVGPGAPAPAAPVSTRETLAVKAPPAPAAARPAAASAPSVKAVTPGALVAKGSGALTVGAKPSGGPTQPAKLTAGSPSVTPKVVAPLAAAPAVSSKGVAAGARKGGFLLQLSSFQDRAEADALARRFAAQNAYVVTTDVPGKGTVYRVRVGSYASMKEAAAAKTTFEHEHNVIAYVAGTGPVQ